MLAPASEALVAWKVVEKNGEPGWEKGWTSGAMVSPLPPVVIDGVLNVLDIRYRMLKNPELARAMSFEDEESRDEFTGTDEASLLERCGTDLHQRPPSSGEGAGRISSTSRKRPRIRGRCRRTADRLPGP